MSLTAQKCKPSFLQQFYRGLYSLLILLLVPFVVLKLLIRGKTRHPDYAKRIGERFGMLPKGLKPGGYLIHCVSVGEVVAAAPLIRAIMQRQPDTVITVTTSSPTGSQRLRDMFADALQHCYLPYDLPFCMFTLFKYLRPKKVLITEVELWPNFIHYCWLRDIPVYIINARMTDKSMRNYQRLAGLLNPTLQKLTGICAQGQRDYQNYRKLGMPEEKIALTHNIKFALQVDDKTQDSVSQFIRSYGLGERKVWIAASTHDPEEKQVLKAHKQLLQQYPELLLVLVPRHPQRFERVEQWLKKKKYIQQVSSDSTPVQADTQVLLINEMGKLKSAYGAADFAFVGGSIANKGGHNALEAAVFGIPIMMGPHTYNNPEICQVLQQAGALVTVTCVDDVVESAQLWLQSEQQRFAAGQCGKEVIRRNAGALDKTLEIVLR